MGGAELRVGVSPHRERVLRGTIASEHVVQLFDEPDSLVAGVSAYLLDGCARGDNLLVVARPTNWALTSVALDMNGCPVADLLDARRLVVLDARTTMGTFMVQGDPDPKRFDENVASLVKRLCDSSPAGLTVYGEMVDILVAQGNYVGAERLEELWNGLSERCSFRRLCGYSSAHFGDERTAGHLHKICDAHTNAGSRPADLLGTWLLANRGPRYRIA